MKIDGYEVKPCPFCGSERLRISNNRVNYWAACRDCAALGPEEKTAEEAVKKWNSVYPAMDADFADVWVKALANERNKKIYNSDDIEWILEKVRAMKVNINYILDQIAVILGGAENDK